MKDLLYSLEKRVTKPKRSPDALEFSTFDRFDGFDSESESSLAAHTLFQKGAPKQKEAHPFSFCSLGVDDDEVEISWVSPDLPKAKQARWRSSFSRTAENSDTWLSIQSLLGRAPVDEQCWSLI